MNLDNLKRQHQDISQLVNELESFLAQDVGVKAFEISLKIGALAGKLSIHLKSEDDYLYPLLINSSDSRTNMTAKKFQQEMGNIAQSFLDYKANYLSSSRIKHESDKFVADTKVIISALRMRIKKEDELLYSLLEKSASSAARSF